MLCVISVLDNIQYVIAVKWLEHLYQTDDSCFPIQLNYKPNGGKGVGCSKKCWNNQF